MTEKMTFFAAKNPTDEEYLIARDAQHDTARKCREKIEKLWKTFEPYADPGFLEVAGRQFNNRLWEMCLGVTLLNQGLLLEPTKGVGPDFSFIFKGRRYWVEAVMASKGSGPDAVLEPVREGIGYTLRLDENKAKLRLINSITEKYGSENKVQGYTKWLQEGLISPSDVFIVAVNSYPLRWSMSDSGSRFPCIVKAVYGVGGEYWIWDNRYENIEDGGLETQIDVPKVQGMPVKSDYFVDASMEGLSGIIYSNELIYESWSSDPFPSFIFVDNHNAKNIKAPELFSDWPHWGVEDGLVKQKEKLRNNP